MTGQLIPTSGKRIALNRTFLAAPTLTAPSQFSVGTGTTDPILSDTGLETVVAINGGNLKNFVSGFPTIDAVNNQATIRAFLNTLEANGNDITEVGMFNSDGTPVLFSRATFNVIPKTVNNEITFVEVDKVV